MTNHSSKKRTSRGSSSNVSTDPPQEMNTAFLGTGRSTRPSTVREPIDPSPTEEGGLWSVRDYPSGDGAENDE